MFDRIALRSILIVRALGDQELTQIVVVDRQRFQFVRVEQRALSQMIDDDENQQAIFVMNDELTEKGEHFRQQFDRSALKLEEKKRRKNFLSTDFLLPSPISTKLRPVSRRPSW